ncbi:MULTISPECIES: LysR substrate-binding domain-containing protein [Bradyrhizobium]|uniref:Transcriptional regulator n=3 Tax=Bradyrhizobium TaxID=374 RepID=A0A410VJ65_9BRAD|nr:MULTISPECIES: LysR substrate-binding domain-containing protein [Bradyrhizobium]MCG2629347.1 LysR substrate-binding domain-containing protein [Bradyrhizobium zhengyangense]MCG2644628.1 LysR substrate-binding domain-containing protein [Bradyrhizobium zhengyangense]MCG2670861.1 LysR substrate-binding domain-containing protein [Bradyrhizobium zhengyangense]MDN4984494.1 LysR substrate-binding domain-containing protein [Bradyrhizobium sp. WYCCWR 13022]MDN5002486.1 LysR substrate-binding domain-co
MHFDLVDLRLLVLVVDRGGLAAAARHANLSVSALSERMKSLEERAGLQLFERTVKGTRPTSAGLEFAGHARSILMQAERLSGAVRSWRKRERGLIRMRANSNAIASFLPDVLASYLARHPDVTVDLQEQTSDLIAVAVRAGEADLGIAAENAQFEGLRTEPFGVDRLVVLVPPGHWLADYTSIGFAEVLNEHFIGLDEQASIQTYLADHARRLGRELVIRIRLRGFESVCRMVAAGAGVAVVPVSVISSSVKDAGARAVELSDNWAQRNLVVCLPVDRPVSDLVQRLIADIARSTRSRFAEIGGDAGPLRT